MTKQEEDIKEIMRQRKELLQEVIDNSFPKIKEDMKKTFDKLGYYDKITSRVWGLLRVPIRDEDKTIKEKDKPRLRKLLKESLEELPEAFCKYGKDWKDKDLLYIGMSNNAPPEFYKKGKKWTGLADFLVGVIRGKEEEMKRRSWRAPREEASKGRTQHPIY